MKYTNYIKNKSRALWRPVLTVLWYMLVALSLTAQDRVVQGTVSDATGEPVIGASIRVNGTTRGTITDIDGRFTIQAAVNEKLTVTFIGYLDAVVTASSTNLPITLMEDSKVLDEVVVVGYGTQKKATLTGAVSAINNKEMIVTKNENVVNMLSGKIPGIRITQSSSQPGEFDNKIDIRGMGTPLIVVDGIPRDQAYFSRMDANEIESVSVLKDASAAIYGIRAANGVILVTTKRGEASTGKFDITFSLNYGWQQFLYIPETASAVDHMLLVNEKGYNKFTNYPIRLEPEYKWDAMMLYSSEQKKSTNWAKELFKNNVPQQQYNISMNGGTEKVSYFFNLGYMDQQGSYRSGSLNYNRWNFRSNVSAKITNRLKAEVQTSGYMDEKNQPYTDIWAVYKKAWTYKPTSQAWIDGDHSLPAYDSEMLESENPVAATDSRLTGFRKEKRVNFNGALSLTYDIPGVKGLNARAFYSYDYYTTNNTYLKRLYHLYNRRADGVLESFPRNTDNPSLRRSTDPAYGTVMQLSLNYANVFGDHSVNGLILFEEQYNNWDNFYAQRVLILDGEDLSYGEDSEQVASMHGAGEKTRQALVGRVNYDYKGRYMADLSFRYDGSSSFPKASRWGFFPAISIGWRMSEELFLKESVPFLSNLKLRASYGEMGDDGGATTYPQTAIAYEIKKDILGYYYNGKYMSGISATAIPNPELTWFTAKTYNLGLDFALWNQKLIGTVDVFKRKRDGLLATSSAIIPGTVGAAMPNENLESDETFGWEISLGHYNRINGITYWVNGQISAAKNRWDFHLDSEAGNSMEAWRRTNVSGRNKDIWFALMEAGRFSNYDQIRYYGKTGENLGQGTLPGDYYYEDWNGDGIVNGDDKHPVANFNLPVFNYGITLGAEWKGIDLSMNWQGSAGVYNSYNEVFAEVAPFDGGAVLDIYKDRWHTVNTWDDPWNPNTEWVSGLYPATGHHFHIGTTGIQNTSYLRLKSLEIGYTLPKSSIRKVGIQDIRIYVNAYNLLTISGLDNIDPERPGHQGGANENEKGGVLFYNYPVNRTFNIGATIKF